MVQRFILAFAFAVLAAGASAAGQTTGDPLGCDNSWNFYSWECLGSSGGHGDPCPALRDAERAAEITMVAACAAATQGVINAAWCSAASGIFIAATIARSQSGC